MLFPTMEDMFVWDRALHTDKLLNKKYRDLMFIPNRDVPEVKAAGGRPHSVYGYGWQINTRTHPVTKRRTKVVNHGGAINGCRAMENRLVDDDAFVIVLCNQGDPYGGTEVWNAVVRLSAELIHVVTGQPFRMPGKARVTQDQRMYKIVQSEGVEAAVTWFKDKGKRAAWGGSFLSLVEQLIKDGYIDDGLRLMELDVELTPGKVWLIRKTSQAFLDNGRPVKALVYASKGLELRPDDERFSTIKAEASEATDTSKSKISGTSRHKQMTTIRGLAVGCFSLALIIAADSAYAQPEAPWKVGRTAPPWADVEPARTLRLRHDLKKTDRQNGIALTRAVEMLQAGRHASSGTRSLLGRQEV